MLAFGSIGVIPMIFLIHFQLGRLRCYLPRGMDRMNDIMLIAIQENGVAFLPDFNIAEGLPDILKLQVHSDHA
ncbi:hypothetical protein D3C77_590590 [compost metagenome]